MFSSYALHYLHEFTGWLLQPVIYLLGFFLVLSIYELGRLAGEYFGGIKRLQNHQDTNVLIQEGKKRIERAEFITRISPMLGLMGTLIPLGPGLSALGDGDLDILATAMSVAFDTTVVGLLLGMVGFVLSRVRRRWYEQAYAQMVSNEEDTAEVVS